MWFIPFTCYAWKLYKKELQKNSENISSATERRATEGKQGKTTHFLFSLLSTLSCLDFAFKLHSNKARASRIELIAIYCRKKSVKNTFWTGNFTAESSFKKQTNKLPDLWTERLLSEGKRFELKKIYPKIDAVEALTRTFLSRGFFEE